MCHFWEDKSRLTELPKTIPVKKHEMCGDPMSADPIRPFPACLVGDAEGLRAWRALPAVEDRAERVLHLRLEEYTI